MNFTKKNKKSNNKTQKRINNSPEIKMLKKEILIYGAKNKDLGGKVLEYTKSNENKKRTHCVYDNISWFAELEQAKHYKGKNDLIFKWKVNKPLKMIKISERNEKFFKNIFTTNTFNYNPKKSKIIYSILYRIYIL